MFLGGGFLGSGAPKPVLPAVPLAGLSARWHPDYSVVTKSGSNVLTATDIFGSNNLTAAVQTNAAGPIEMYDAVLGRKFWRFNRRHALTWSTGSLSTTNMACWVVMKSHRGSGYAILSLGTTAGSSNTNGATLKTSASNGLAPFLLNANISANTASSGKEKLIVGAQLQVLGAVSGSGASSTRLYMNRDFVTVAGPTASSGWVGGAIGYYVQGPGTLDLTSDPWADMDVYDVLIYSTKQSNADADTTAAALQAAYNIADITKSLVLEGDSITQGFYPSVLGGDGLSMQMVIPPGWRVINIGTSGNQSSDLVTRRDATNGTCSAGSMLGGALSGKNYIVLQIGANDLSTGARSAANVYNEASVTNSICALINNASNGYNKNFDRIYYAVNIANGNSTNSVKNDALRVLLRDIATFRTDAGCTSANLNLIDLALITGPSVTGGPSSGGTLFDTGGGGTSSFDTGRTIANNPNDAIYFDTLHPIGANNVGRPGGKYMARGGAWDGGGIGDGYMRAFAP